jgi:hypothetical protein
MATDTPNEIRINRACVDMDDAVMAVATDHALSYGEIVDVLSRVAATYRTRSGRADDGGDQRPGADRPGA